MFAQMPAFDLLPAGAQHAFVVGLLFGAGVEAAVDGGVDGPAEGFADALGGIGEVSVGCVEWMRGAEWMRGSWWEREGGRG